jgi:hypothetical protein
MRCIPAKGGKSGFEKLEKLLIVNSRGLIGALGKLNV